MGRAARRPRLRGVGEPMAQGTPFANVLLIGTVGAAGKTS
jgi:hypothetical protein